MKKIILMVLILSIIVLTGCKKKSNAKYIETIDKKDIDILVRLDYENEKHYKKGEGFINGMNSRIVVKDVNNKIIDISNNKEIYRVRNVNYSLRYYKVYTGYFNIKINNTYYKNKNLEYNARLGIQLDDPTILLKKQNTDDMKVEDLYKKYIKSIIDMYLNKAIDKSIEKELKDLDMNKVNEEFNKLAGNDTGFKITIETIEFIDK